MDEDKVVLYVSLAFAAYIVYKKLFDSPLSDTQGQNALRNAGATTWSDGRGNTNMAINGGIAKIYPGEFNNLNPAQRILIGLDRIIPGSWLTEKVLT